MTSFAMLKGGSGYKHCIKGKLEKRMLKKKKKALLGQSHYLKKN